MTSSTSLYSSTPGNANVASQNFTTLYSGAGAINPTQAYGNANVVSLLAVGTDGGNTIGNISATGNVTADYFIGNINAGNIVGNVNFANTAGTAQFVTGNAQANITSVGTLTSLSVSGNVTGGNLLTGGTVTATGNITAPNFIGNVIGNLSGNVAAAGSNTQIQFNTGNILDASANLTFNKSNNTIKVTGNSSFPTAGLEINANTITGNLALGNLLITNQFQALSRGAVVIDTNELIVGQDNAGLGTNAIVRAIRNQALELTSTNAGAPSVYVGKYVGNSATYTGNVDVRSSNVGGYGGTGNINLTGNVYVGRNAQGADTANALANLIVTDSVYVNQNLSVAGNILFSNLSTAGNITAGNLITSGNLFGNVVGQVFTSPGNANVIIRQLDGVNQANAVYLDANNVIIGNAGNSSKLVAASTNQLILAVSGSGGPQMYFGPASTGNVDLRSSGGAAIGGFAANGNINLSGNVFIGNGASQTAPASTGLNLAVAGTISAAGNITANASSFFIGNGSQLTGIVAVSTYGNANVADFLGNGFGSNTITTTGNITSGNLLTGGVVSATGNVDAGNLRTAGLISATGNVSGGNVIVPVNGRYYGDFTTGTASGRTAFQTTATGTSAATSLTAIPGVNHVVSNTGFSSQLNLFASTDVGNSSFSRMQQLGNRLVFGTSSTGTGTAGNINIAAGSAQIWLLTTGNVGIGNANPEHSLAVQGNAYVGTDLSVNGNISVGSNFSTANISVQNINGIGNAGVTVNSEMFVYGNLLPFGNVLMQANQVLYAETIGLTAIGNGTGSLSAAGNITGGNINTGGIVSATGNITTGSFFKAQSYTAAALTAITGSIGQIAAVSNSAGGSHPNGMLAFWDTTNARWSYIHDNSAV